MTDIDQASEEVTLSDIENLDCTANGCTPNISRGSDQTTEVVETETHQDSDVPAIASVGALAAVAISAGAFMMKKTFAAQNKSEEESLL